jgi:hypothetical protein
MRIRWAALGILLLSLWTAAPSGAETDDLSRIIEHFVVAQFPGAHSHFWVVNGTQWQDEDELVIDVNAVVTARQGQSQTENRFLLLIVAGRLEAAQNIPLGAGPDCKPEAV